LAKTRANEGGDDTNLPYKISARDFRKAPPSSSASFSVLGLSPPFGIQLYNLPPPPRPSHFFLSSCSLFVPRRVNSFAFPPHMRGFGKVSSHCLFFSTLTYDIHSIALSHIRHQVALPSGCIPLLLYQTCGEYMRLGLKILIFTKLYSVHTQSHIHQASDLPLASIATPTANRAHLGPLDLAPSRNPQKSPPLSPCSSPRRPPLPLTPPLTPSSLNDGASQGGLPATPTDLDPTSAALWRRKSKYHPQKGLLSSDSDELIGDATPTDRPYAPSTQSQQPDSKSPLSRYLRLDSLPSRILLVS